MPTSHEILHQLASDFEEVARRVQMTIEAHPNNSAEIARLAPVRDKAFHGAFLARQALGGLKPEKH